MIKKLLQFFPSSTRKKNAFTPFTEGVHNDLITISSRIDDLTIISAGSMRRLNHENFPILNGGVEKQ